MEHRVKINNETELKIAVDLCHKQGIDWTSSSSYVPSELSQQSIVLSINHKSKVLTYSYSENVIKMYDDIITLQEFISYMNINSSTEHVLTDSLFKVDEPNLKLDK